MESRKRKRACTLDNQVSSNEEGASHGENGGSLSRQVVKTEDKTTGACLPEDCDSSNKDPPITLSQMLHKTLSEQQEREKQRKSELDKRNLDIIAKFIVEYIEPLLKAQALSGLSKTLYWFIPSGTQQAKLTGIMPRNKKIVEGYGGSDKAGPLISKVTTKEYVKVIRLIGQEYGLAFWQQPSVMKELQQKLKSRLQSNGEKLAETTRNSAGRSWKMRSFADGEKLSPGYTGVVTQFSPVHQNISAPSYFKMIHLYAEIA